jgi:vacuolar-type H+-ATPase subunit I/STV1
MPTFLERVRGVPIAQASVSFGEIVVITGFVGTFAGGWLSDYLLRYSRQAYLWFSGAVTVLAAPAAYLALAAASREVYMPAIVVAELLLFMSTGPINAAIVNLVVATERATAIALGVFAIHLLGDVLSPFLIGAFSDVSSLAEAVKIVPVAVLIGACVWIWAARAQARTPADG